MVGGVRGGGEAVSRAGAGLTRLRGLLVERDGKGGTEIEAADRAMVWFTRLLSNTFYIINEILLFTFILL